MGLTGEEIVYGLKKGTVWGTETVCTAGDGFLGLPWAADPDNQTITDDSLGMFFAIDASPGQTKLDATVSAYARYDDEVLLSMLAAFFGTTSGVPTTHTGGTLSRDHTLKIAKNVDGIFFTLAAKLGTGFVESIPSWKVESLEITWDTGKPTVFKFAGPAFDLLGNSAVNTMATMASVTILETANRAYMGQALFRMNAQSGAALGASDSGETRDVTFKIGPSKAVLSLKRKLTGVYGSYTDGGAGRDLIDEPTNDGQPEGTLSLTFPKLKDNTGRLAIKGNTSQKLEIIMTGPIIEGSIPYRMTFQLPNIKPSKNTNPHKHGIIENTREFAVLGAASAPTGMTGNTDPCWCMLVNRIATDLAA